MPTSRHWRGHPQKLHTKKYFKAYSDKSIHIANERVECKFGEEKCGKKEFSKT